MDKLLTIVVPVYKVEKYINKCLDSLIVPDDLMEQLEVIVVNDGTPDRSAEMAREYGKKYPHTFRVIDKVNGGHGSAWNLGVQLATGKYLRFLDSDDWFDTENLSFLLMKFPNLDVDIVFTDLNIFHSENCVNERRSFETFNSELLYDGEEYDWSQIKLNTNFHYCFYRTSLIKSFHPLFLEKQSYDDAILKVVFIQATKSFVYYPVVIYNYLLGREEQSMNKSNMLKKYGDITKLIESMIDFYRNNLIKQNKKKSIKGIIDTYCMEHFALLSELPYSESKREIASFYSLLHEKYPECKESRKMKLYNIVPFFIYKSIVDIFLNIYAKNVDIKAKKSF